MKKVKVRRNNIVVSYDFYCDLLAKDRLYKICELFNLHEVYVNIYLVDIRKKNLYETLTDSKLCEKIFCIPNKHLQNVYIKIAVDNLPAISTLFRDFEFDDLTIWDCYTSWEKYLEIKTAKMPFFTFKPIKVEGNSKFYLDFNLYEGDQVEMICDISYDSQELTESLNELLK